MDQVGDHRASSGLLVEAFPTPGPRVQLAYRELEIAAHGTEEQRAALGAVHALARPWSPGSCKASALRVDLWRWLDEVVIWLNRQYVFDPVDIIPPCWPQHPHLVNELAVLADRRRTAERSLDSEYLEDWHRYALPSFHDRMRTRLAEHCQDGHATIRPASAREAWHVDGSPAAERRAAFREDLAARGPSDEEYLPALRLVDTGSGEILD